MKQFAFISFISAAILFSAPFTHAGSGPRPIKKAGAITAPGSYILAADITATNDAIVIQADNVTLDLGGHTITGAGTGNGISDGGIARKNIVIRNGTVTGFDKGVSMYDTAELTVDSIHAANNSNRGIAGFSKAVIQNCFCEGNGDGISFAYHCIIRNNISNNNTGTGIVTSGKSIVSGNIANSNTINGIVCAGPCNVLNNVAQDNGNIGIYAECPSTVTGNSASGNTTANLSTNGGGCATQNNAAP